MHEPENRKDPEMLEHIKVVLEQLDNGQKPYLDVDEIEDMCDYLFEDERVAEAERLTEYGMTLHPESVNLMLTRASMLIDNNKFDQAKALLDYVLPMECNNPELYLNYGWLELKQNNVEEAIVHFDEALELNEKNHMMEDDIIFEIGLNLNLFDYFSQSTFYLEMYIERHPHDPKALFELAYAYDKTQLLDKSIITYEHLVDISPFYETAWYNLGILYWRKEEYEKSVNAYNTAITINVEYPEPYFNLGNNYMNMGEYEKALDSYIEYISLCKTDIENVVYQYIGECWAELDDSEYSLQFYLLATEKMPDNANAWYGCGVEYMDLGNNPQCINMVSKAIDIDPECADYYFTVAHAYANMMQKDIAIPMLEMALHYAPNDVYGWLELLKLNLLRDASFNIPQFIEDAYTKYGRNEAIKYMHAFVLHTAYKNKEREVVRLLSEIAASDKSLLYDVLDHPYAGTLLRDSKIMSKLEKMGIKI